VVSTPRMVFGTAAPLLSLVDAIASATAG
jgi:hypothetical protein